MKDDAIYCEHPGGAKMAYIPFWRHELLECKRRKTAKIIFIAVTLISFIAGAVLGYFVL